MEIINNLPVILAALSAFLAGLYGYINNLPNARVYQHMCLFLIVFYIIGMLLKRTVSSIWEDIAEKARLAANEGLLQDEPAAGIPVDDGLSYENIIAAPGADIADSNDFYGAVGDGADGEGEDAYSAGSYTADANDGADGLGAGGSDDYYAGDGEKIN